VVNRRGVAHHRSCLLLHRLRRRGGSGGRLIASQTQRIAGPSAHTPACGRSAWPCGAPAPRSASSASPALRASDLSAHRGGIARRQLLRLKPPQKMLRRRGRPAPFCSALRSASALSRSLSRCALTNATLAKRSSYSARGARRHDPTMSQPQLARQRPSLPAACRAALLALRYAASKARARRAVAGAHRWPDRGCF
jgi:hypothetical protein